MVRGVAGLEEPLLESLLEDGRLGVVGDAADRQPQQSPRVAVVSSQRPQRDRVLAAAVEADHSLGLREVPLEREARVLAAQGQRERICGVVMVPVGSRAVGVTELQEKVLAVLSPDRRVRELPKRAVYRLCRGSFPSTT